MNLLKTLMSHLTPDMMGRIAALLEARPEVVSKAVSAAVPAIFGGLVSLGGDEKGASRLLDILKDIKLDVDDPEGVAALVGPQGSPGGMGAAGSALVGALFGPKIDQIVRSVSGFASLPGDGVGKLFGVLGPLAAGVLMKAAPTGGYSPASLAQLLQTQKAAVAEAAPPGLTALLGNLPGLEGLAPPVAAPAAAPQSSSQGPSSVLPWVLLAAFAAMVLLGPRACSTLENAAKPVTGSGIQGQGATAQVQPPKEPVVTAKGDTKDTTKAAPAKEAGESAVKAGRAETPKETPPDAASTGPRNASSPAAIQELDFPRRSLAGRVHRYLQAGDHGSRTFASRDLGFGFAAANLPPHTSRALKDLGAVLAAHPSAKVKFVGHTDATGSRSVNRALSEARAKAVREALVGFGVDPQRVSFSGAGEAHPVARNSTASGRRANRRVEVVVSRS